MWAPQVSPISSESHWVKLRAPFGAAAHLDQPAIGVLPVPGRYPLRDYRARRIAPEMDHLGPGIGLLVVVGDGDGIERADRIVALQHAARVLPRDRRACLDLGPGDFRPVAPAGAPLGDEVVDAALAVLVAGIPVLDGRILDLCIVQRDQLDDRGVELVLVPHRRGAAFEIAHIGGPRRRRSACVRTGPSWRRLSGNRC